MLLLSTTTYNNDRGEWVISRPDGTTAAYLDWEQARSVYCAYRRKVFQEQLEARLDECQNDDGSYFIGSIPSVVLSEHEVTKFVEAALDDYEEAALDSNEWERIADKHLALALDASLCAVE